MAKREAFEKIFVTSSGDEPRKIRYCFDDAVAEDDDYIDEFDKSGERVKSYKRIESGKYTTAF